MHHCRTCRGEEACSGAKGRRRCAHSCFAGSWIGVFVSKMDLRTTVVRPDVSDRDMAGKSRSNSIQTDRVFLDLEKGQDGLAAFPPESIVHEARLMPMSSDRLDDEGAHEPAQLLRVEPANEDRVDPPWASAQSVSSSAALVVLLAGGLAGGWVGWRSATILPPAVVESKVREVAAPPSAPVVKVDPAPVANVDHAPVAAASLPADSSAPTSGAPLPEKKSEVGSVGTVPPSPRKPSDSDARTVEFAAMTAEPPPARTIEAPPVQSPIVQPAEVPAKALEVPVKAPPAPAEISAPRASTPSVSVVAPRPDRVDDEADVRAALSRYQAAYEHLDAAAVKRVWPGVDQRALSKAFANLESQSFEFGECRTAVTSGTAVAHCSGSATYVGRFGSRNSQTQNRQWTFKLRKEGSAWEVQDVQVR
jgi:hypothetical protein